jgi:hypothetical protein
MESSTKAFLVLMCVVLVAVGLAIFFSGGSEVDEPSKDPDAPVDEKDDGKTEPGETEPGRIPPVNRRPPVRERKLRGLVKDVEGQPVAGARVLLYPARRRMPDVSLSEEEEYRRQVVADLFQFYPEDTKALHPLGMRVADEEPEVAETETFSDASGAFAFDDPPLGKVRVYAEKGELASTMVTTLSRGRVTLVVKGAAAIRGQVLSADDGRMVSGATVRLLSGSRPLSASTGDDGAFTLKGLSAGPVTVFAAHPDYAGALKKGVILKAGEAVEVTILMTAGYKLQVKVTGEEADGTNEVLVPGATVGAYRVEDQGYVLAESGSDGIAVLEGLPPGTYLVNGRAEGYLPAGEEKVPLQADRDWELILEKAIKTTVLVVDDRDVPIADAELWTANIDEEFETGVSKKVGATNRDGEFPFPFDWDGKEAALFVAKEGYGMAMVQPDDPAEGGVFKIKLHEGRSVRGRVTDTDGKPVAGAMIYIEVTPDDIEEEDLYATLYTDADGRYGFERLPPGDIWIDVTADGFDTDDAEIETGSNRRRYVKNFQLEAE